MKEAKINVDRHIINVRDIEDIKEVTAQSANTQGAFEFGTQSLIILRNTKDVDTKLTISEIRELIADAVNDLIVDETQEHQESTPDTIVEDALESLVKVGEANLKATKQMVEHMHTMSEMITRLVIFITEGTPITIKKINN